MVAQPVGFRWDSLQALRQLEQFLNRSSGLVAPQVAQLVIILFVTNDFVQLHGKVFPTVKPSDRHGSIISKASDLTGSLAAP